MFKRRNRRTLIESAREWVWPRAGWNRLLLYYRHRLVRMPDSSYRIAAGLACGVAISFTPFIGLHVALGMGLAFAMRANVLAAVIGTIVGNPWTFPFIWSVTYWMGSMAMGLDGAVALTDVIDTKLLFHSPLQALKPVLLPMIIGGIPLGVLVWWLVYWPSHQVIDRYKIQRARRLQRQENMSSKPGNGTGNE